jgi:hypothetical protein
LRKSCRFPEWERPEIASLPQEKPCHRFAFALPQDSPESASHLMISQIVRPKPLHRRAFPHHPARREPAKTTPAATIPPQRA